MRSHLTKAGPSSFGTQRDLAHKAAASSLLNCLGRRHSATLPLRGEELPMSRSPHEAAGPRIRTHSLPPAGFDPRTASPLDLRRYGLPQRPDPRIRPKLADSSGTRFSPAS